MRLIDTSNFETESYFHERFESPSLRTTEWATAPKVNIWCIFDGDITNPKNLRKRINELNLEIEIPHFEEAYYSNMANAEKLKVSGLSKRWNCIIPKELDKHSMDCSSLRVFVEFLVQQWS